MSRIEALSSLIGVAPAPAPSEAERTYLNGFLSGLQVAERQSARGVPMLPPNAPLAPATRLWLDGVLAGLFGRDAAPLDGPAPAVKTSVVVLWASQTGRAEELGQRVAARLAGTGLDVRLTAMADYTIADIAAARNLVAITSTYGDGEPPDNGAPFWEAITHADAPQLRHLRYAVLALGDPSYDKFCGHGRALDARLHELGGARIMERVDCDPDFESAAKVWLDEIVSRIAMADAPASVAEQADTAATVTSSPAAPNRRNPYKARVLGDARLNPGGPTKDVRHIVFGPESGALAYEAGGSLGLWPANIRNGSTRFSKPPLWKVKRLAARARCAMRCSTVSRSPRRAGRCWRRWRGAPAAIWLGCSKRVGRRAEGMAVGTPARRRAARRPGQTCGRRVRSGAKGLAAAGESGEGIMRRRD